jgi:outer membrane protein assembly factor BamB
LNAQTQWRNDRTGIYANETGLLKSWPEGGPQELWYFDGLGDGHSSVIISNNKLYVTGMTGSKGYLYVFDMEGKLLTKKDYGDEWDVNYNGSRGTAAISDGKIYIVSGTGNIVCFDETNLNIVWQKNFLTAFGGRNLRWGINESPLIIGEKLILTPGGSEHSVVALNKNDGSLIWSSKGEGELSAFCSPIYIADNNIVPQIVTMTAGHILGIDVANGRMLWSFPYRTRNAVHSNSPFYKDNTLLCLASGTGAVMLRFRNGGREVEKMWEAPRLDPVVGHSMVVGDYIYCSGDINKFWFCANRHTGEILYQDNTLPPGAVIFADGMLYCYTERGVVALVKPDAEKFNIVSRFTVVRGTDQHWAHPVIHNGVLYIRHGDSLMAYKVK